MRRKHLESALSSVQREFPNPNAALEQYATSPHLAASTILLALERQDVGPGRTVLDLGCGTGMLALACALVESDFVYGLDCDAEALAMAHENVVELELNDRVAFVYGVVAGGSSSSVASFAMKPKPKQSHRKTQRGPKDVQQRPSAATAASAATKTKVDDAELRHRFPFRRKSVDTVVCNPPFGTKRAGIDIEFLNVACEVATRAVYSFHKTSTRSFVLKQVVEKMGYTSATVVAEMRFDIPRSYEFHKQDSVDVAVDLIRVDLTTASAADDDEPPVRPS